MTPEDQLRRFAERRDEAAFGEVVKHYTALVYSLALRRCGQAEMAAEIAQDVFLVCARKAPALTKAGTPLGPWLHRTTLLETMNHLRKEAARRRRLEAFERETEESLASTSQDPSMNGLEHLDEAMNRLSVSDRSAVLLRFYSGRSFSEMGEVMGCTAEAARKHCTRAVRKLSLILSRRGVVLPATGLAAVMPGYWTSLKAAVPPALGGRIAEHVARELSLATTTVSSPWITLSAMKLSASTTAAWVLVLIAVPAGWYWMTRKPTGSPAASATEARPPMNRSHVQRVGPPGLPDTDMDGGARDPEAPTEAAVRAVVERLLEMRPRLGTEKDFDVSTQLEREQIWRRMQSWPADAVRSALDLLVAGPASGRQAFLTAESILDNVYAAKAPAEATVLGMSLLERDPMFRRGTRWSAAEWFRTDPDAARRWLADQEGSGQLESTAVEDVKRNVLREAQITGLAQVDASAAQRLLRETSPDIAFNALSALIERSGGVPASIDFPSLALASPDAETAGRILGLQARSGTQPMWEAASAGSKLAAALSNDLPPDVRQTALVEGSMVGGPRESLATLIHASSAETRDANLQAMAQRLVRSGRLEPALLDDPLLAPWHDPVAVAIASALQNAEGAAATTAAVWVDRISDPHVKERFAACIPSQP